MRLSQQRTFLVLGIAIFALNPFQTQAQGTVNVNVTLKDFTGFSAVSPSGSQAVNFTYASASDYNSAKSVEVTDQLRFTSTRNYNIQVLASGALSNGTNTIPLSILRISAKLNGGATYGTEITPTTTAQTIVTGALATLDQGFDIKYAIPVDQAKTVLFPSTAAKSSTGITYNTTITYSTTAI